MKKITIKINEKKEVKERKKKNIIEVKIFFI